jgi:hypothetical protein
LQETDVLKGPSICWLAALSLVLTLVCIGCAPERSSTLTSYPLCCAALDECREVELSYGVGREREGLEPVRKYEMLTLEVRPRPSLRSKHVLKTIEQKPGSPSGELRFLNVRVRTDETGQRIWFVESSTGRILATLDRQTGRTTGPDDEPPAWAKPDGGHPLGASCGS